MEKYNLSSNLHNPMILVICKLTNLQHAKEKENSFLMKNTISKNKIWTKSSFNCLLKSRIFSQKINKMTQYFIKILHQSTKWLLPLTAIKLNFSNWTENPKKFDRLFIRFSRGLLMKSPLVRVILYGKEN